MSCRAASCHVAPRHVMSRCVTSRRGMPCHAAACHVTPRHAMSRRVMPCQDARGALERVERLLKLIRRGRDRAEHRRDGRAGERVAQQARELRVAIRDMLVLLALVGERVDAVGEREQRAVDVAPLDLESGFGLGLGSSKRFMLRPRVEWQARHMLGVRTRARTRVCAQGKGIRRGHDRGAQEHAHAHEHATGACTLTSRKRWPELSVLYARSEPARSIIERRAICCLPGLRRSPYFSTPTQLICGASPSQVKSRHIPSTQVETSRDKSRQVEVSRGKSRQVETSRDKSRQIETNRDKSKPLPIRPSSDKAAGARFGLGGLR